MEYILECENLTKMYKDNLALSNVNLKLEDNGAIVGLLGPNGSGKTTLIKLIAGLLTPTAGSIKILGKERGVETKSAVSYLSDAYSLFNDFTVNEQMQFYEYFFYDFNKSKAEKMLIELQINPALKINTLSKGTKEKLALILTLSRDAKLYILDEPIAGVDPAARDYILETIIKMKNENATLIISTHLISEIENYFDHILFIKNGEIVLSGKTEEIRLEKGKSIDELFREVFRWA